MSTILDYMVGKYERLRVYFENLEHPNNTLSYLMINEREDIVPLINCGDRFLMLDFLNSVVEDYKDKMEARREKVFYDCSRSLKERSKLNLNDVIVFDNHEYIDMSIGEAIKFLMSSFLPKLKRIYLRRKPSFTDFDDVFIDDLIKLLIRYPNAYVHISGIEFVFNKLSNNSLFNESIGLRIIWLQRYELNKLNENLNYYNINLVEEDVLKNHTNFYKQEQMFMYGNPDESLNDFV